ncbi:hypothetical protein RDV64_00715 [Acuticoccus sp. MNP-M23]|uniref:hypothetical protein n=1 Tax=Acuticoccus sp. MNP-M23 TaxID=3072793 RepID=UPI002814C05A|nr:hypothetical protein [Acuticoccus sp. MNP-M23]WMS42957.1 hypothetical protein RDV64_00715 [Acuticoccus sp. MNP-M23]
MRLAALLPMFLIAFGSAAPAADLPRLFKAPAPPVATSYYCIIVTTSGQLEVFQEPQGEVWGFLPAGMEVEIMEAPTSPSYDLWVRIKPPRHNLYYGWVPTAAFRCA